jgi:pimeloyl-ACP methyl ester carboxylesterase
MTNRRGFLQSVQASDTTDVVEFAGRITAPTLLAVGSEDRVNPPEVSRAIHEAIPGSRLVVLPGIGHLPKLEAPDQTVALLRSHLLEET